jgi:hypothetical protein
MEVWLVEMIDARLGATICNLQIGEIGLRDAPARA